MFKINSTLKLIRILDSQLLPNITNIITEYMGDESYYLMEYDYRWDYTIVKIFYGNENMVSKYINEKHGNYLLIYQIMFKTYLNIIFRRYIMEEIKFDPDQKKAISDFRYNNVIVDSVAGSGKTTLALGIAQTYEEEILMLTYNKKLADETKQKVVSKNIKNMDCYTFHSFGYNKYGNKKCINDTGLSEICKNNSKPEYRIRYSRIIIDEAQDKNRLFSRFIKKILKDNEIRNYLICILGDKKQCINQYRGSDERFLTYGDKIYKNGKNWIKNQLKISYRLTDKMALFVNNCVLKENRLVSVRKGSENDVVYKWLNSYSEVATQYLYTEFIHRWLSPKERGGCGARFEDIFILAPSIKKGNSPIMRLENYLTKKGILVYTPADDDYEMNNPELIKNKIIFSTFHQAKGMEKKYVIVFSFDNSYFEYYGNGLNPKECPNPLYVATTRAKNQMVLIHTKGKDFLPFLNLDVLKNYINVDYIREEDKKSKEKPKKLGVENARMVNVTDMVRFIPSEEQDLLVDLILPDKGKFIDDIGEINIDNITTDTRGNKENIGDITGIAIPRYYELKVKKEPIPTINELLKECNQYISDMDGFKGRIHQITKFDWINQEQLDLSFLRMKNAITTSKLTFEKSYELLFYDKRLKGRIDCIENDEKSGTVIWEFKFTNDLKNEHILQLYIYGYLFYMKEKKIPSLRLLNIRTGELIKIDNFNSNLAKIVISKLLDIRSSIKDKINDDEFLGNC